MKKCIIFALFFAVFSLASLFLSSGYSTRTDVMLQDYIVSEDGTTISVKTGLAGSMGYIRAIQTEHKGDIVFCTFYSAWGGLNSSIGAKNCFDIEVDTNIKRVFFDRGNEPAALVLERNLDTNEWERPQMR